MPKTKKFLSVILAVLMLMSVSPVAFAEDTEVSITHQPTAAEPYVELSDDTGVTYQWCTVDATEITDRNATGNWDVFDAPAGVYGEYDPGTGWRGNNYYGAAYYFVVELEAGDTVNLEFSSEPDYVEYASSYGWGYAEGSGKSYSFTATNSGIYGFGSKNPEITVKAYIGDIEYTEVEGQTSATLSDPEIGKNYICKITTADSTVLTSDIVSYAYVITHQPTSGEPYVELNYAEGATYQWYEVVFDGVEITDENAEGRYADGNAKATYDAENGWTGVFYSNDYEANFFAIELEASQTVLMQADKESELIGIWANSGDRADLTYPGTETISFTASSDDTYYVYAHCDVDTHIRGYVGEIKNVTLEDETKNELQNPEFGKTYICKVTTADSTVLTTEKMEYVYAITHQPTAAEPYVELNDNTDATYQWYTVKDGTVEITDENADAYFFDGDTSSYDSENGWTGINGYGVYIYFTISLEAGETITVEVDGNGFSGLGLHDFDTGMDIYLYEESGKTTYELTATVAGEYVLYTEYNVSVKAYMEGLEYTKVDGETAATLATTEEDVYACEVTFKDGTTEMSESFTPCAHTDADGDGICDNDCGYEYPAEDTDDSGVCDYCGKVHPTFIQRLFCLITEFFVTLFTAIGLW